MIRRPPRSTRTDTLFPYTTLFRSGHEATDENGSTLREALQDTLDDPWFKGLKTKNAKQSAVAEILSGFNKEAKAIREGTDESYGAQRVAYKRSEVRRVGKELVSKGKSAWWSSH